MKENTHGNNLPNKIDLEDLLRLQSKKSGTKKTAFVMQFFLKLFLRFAGQLLRRIISQLKFYFSYGKFLETLRIILSINWSVEPIKLSSIAL